jgi:hypothetical protein
VGSRDGLLQGPQSIGDKVPHGEGTDTPRGQCRLGGRADGRHQHDVDVANEIDRAFELPVIVAIMLARRRCKAGLDEAQGVPGQIENLKARRSAKVLVNELPVGAADGYAQGALTWQGWALSRAISRIECEFWWRQSVASGAEGEACHEYDI